MAQQAADSACELGGTLLAPASRSSVPGTSPFAPTACWTNNRNHASCSFWTVHWSVWQTVSLASYVQGMWILPAAGPIWRLPGTKWKGRGTVPFMLYYTVQFAVCWILYSILHSAPLLYSTITHYTIYDTVPLYITYSIPYTMCCILYPISCTPYNIHCLLCIIYDITYTTYLPIVILYTTLNTILYYTTPQYTALS